MPKLEQKFKITSKLHVFRAEKRISQEELAKAIGVTRGTIVAIEGGDYNPSLELAFRLAKYMGTDIQSIFQIEEVENGKSK
jgi:putative transcriptional regulator